MYEAFRLFGPSSDDVLKRGEAAQGLEAAGVVVGVDEGGKVLAELVVRAVVVGLERRLSQRAVHPFDLSVGPEVGWLGQAVLDTVRR